jgi:hypothetical protein
MVSAMVAVAVVFGTGILMAEALGAETGAIEMVQAVL